MDIPKLKTSLLVQSIVRQAELANAWPMVLRKGDEDSGGVLVLLYNTERLYRILGQTRNKNGEPAWHFVSGIPLLSEEESKNYIERHIKRDPDLWIVECESKDFSPPFKVY